MQDREHQFRPESCKKESYKNEILHCRLLALLGCDVFGSRNVHCLQWSGKSIEISHVMAFRNCDN